MIKEIWTEIYRNKNLLMLASVIFYVLSLVAVLTNLLLMFSVIILVLFIILILKEFIPAKVVCIWALIFYLGVANISLRIRDCDELLNLAPINSEITGTVISIPQGKNENKLNFYFKVKSIRFNSIEKTFDNEKVLVTLNLIPEKQMSLTDVKLYKSYCFKGRLSKPFKAGNPSQFDYGNYLRNYNTYAVFYANDYKTITVTPSTIQKILQKINDYRERILQVHSTYLKSPNFEILGGIVFGDDAISPPKNIKQSFINSGLLHILAASGMNVAFIYAFFYHILAVFKINFKVNVSLGIIMVLLYLLMTGMGASVVRAAFMLIFVLIGKLIDRDAHSIALLSFVAFLMLLYNPMYINDVSFQLSFIVTFGLLITTPIIHKFDSKMLNFLISIITIPIIAQLWVIPIQIFYFNNISIYSIFANIISNPVLMIISFGGFISSLLSLITPIAHFICKAFDFCLAPMLAFLINISDFWSKLPHSTIQTSHPTILQILLYYILLLCLIICLNKNFREQYLTKIKNLFIVVLIIFLITFIPIKNSNLEIITFDVGNADAFLIKTPENKYMMIDTGKAGYNGGKSQAEIIILKYLKDNGIKKLEALIITHFDNDHCGGAVDLLNNIIISKVYINNLHDNALQAQEIYKTAKKTNTKLELVKNNSEIMSENNLKISNYVYNKAQNDNDKSIITLIKYNTFSILFTGDATQTAIQDVLKYLPQHITVLKIPHHGASRVINREILKHLDPIYSIVSVGENKFDHPNIYTMKLLQNTKILRTDINNSIKITINSKGYKIQTYDMFKRKYQNL